MESLTSVLLFPCLVLGSGIEEQLLFLVLVVEQFVDLIKYVLQELLSDKMGGDHRSTSCRILNGRVEVVRFVLEERVQRWAVFTFSV